MPTGYASTPHSSLPRLLGTSAPLQIRTTTSPVGLSILDCHSPSASRRLHRFDVRLLRTDVLHHDQMAPPTSLAITSSLLDRTVYVSSSDSCSDILQLMADRLRNLSEPVPTSLAQLEDLLPLSPFRFIRIIPVPRLPSLARAVGLLTAAVTTPSSPVSLDRVECSTKILRRFRSGARRTNSALSLRWRAHRSFPSEELDHCLRMPQQHRNIPEPPLSVQKYTRLSHWYLDSARSTAILLVRLISDCTVPSMRWAQ